jgi:hypothetical protein
LWWIPTQKDAKTQCLAPWHWHPTAAATATNNLMTALYFSSEMPGLWPAPGPKKSVEKLAAAPGASPPDAGAGAPPCLFAFLAVHGISCGEPDRKEICLGGA